ncbi:MAG: flavin reductase, partial [Butyrivibrio sp.]|nr:flavin reductase [Butyrivibrio sp.]
NADAMHAAWGGLYDTNQVVLCLSADHKTTKNIRTKGAFTVSFADEKHTAACDYVGIVSGNKEPDKLKKAGFTVTKSAYVDAPVINELPMALECRLVKFNEDGNVIGEIVNVSAEESILGENGTVDPARLRPISFDPVNNGYFVLGERVGSAFSDGAKIELD